MKRILSIIISAAILLSSCCMISFADEVSTAWAEAPYEAGLLNYLGVMSSGDKTDWSKPVSRAEFAIYVYNIAKIGGGNVSAYCTDVAGGSELEEAVSYLVGAGVLSVSESRLFRPDDTVSFAEACKMLVNIAGYDTYARAVGGYPAGYLSVANKLGITVGTGGNEMLRADAAIMLYNTLHAGMFDIEYISNDGSVYSGTNTETVLERFFDIYYTEGAVTMKNCVNLSSDEYAEEGVMAIDGVVYTDLIKDSKLLGYFVEAYVKKSTAGKDSVVYADISPENTVLEIDARDLESISLSEVTYYNESGKLKSAKLSDAVFVKNGSVIGYDIPEKADITKGKLVLISNSASDRYNTVLITEYEIFVMGHLDSTRKKIHDKFDTSKYCSFNEDELLEVNILMNGKNANFMHIEDNDVLSVARSDDGQFVTAVISTDVVSGVVEGIYKDGETVITVDGNDYVLDKALEGRIGSGNALIGSSVELVLDITGEVAHIVTAANGSYKIGFVHKFGVIGSGFSANHALEIYCVDDAENKVYNLAEKLSVNESKTNKTGDDVFDAIDKADEPGVIKPQIIRFKLNGDGEIVGVITADYSENMSQAGYLSKTLEEGNYTYRSNLVYPTTAINENTIILQVPYDSFIAEGGYEHYFRRIDKTSLRTAHGYTFEAYKTNDTTPYTDVLLVKKDRPYKDDNSDSVGIIRKVSRVRDGNGVDVFALEMFVNGVGVKHITNDICIWKDKNDEDIVAGALKEGDFVRFNTDGYGSVGYIKCLYRPSDHENNEELDGMVGSYDARIRLSYHYVADKFEGNEMDAGGVLSLLSLSNAYGGPVTWRLQYSRLNKTIIYDRTKREGSRVYIGNIDNISSYNGTGGADASVIITHANIGTFKNVYIIN